MSAPSKSPNLCGVISEAKSIIKVHAWHFFALWVLFLLPLCFSIIIYPTLQSALSQTNSIFRHHRPLEHLFFSHYTSPHLITSSNSTILFLILYTVCTTLLFICAIGTITYSTFQGFYGRDVKLISTLKSLLSSIFPLCSTYIVIQVIVYLIAVASGVVGVLIYKWLEFIGVDVSYGSKNFTLIIILVSLMAVVHVAYIQLNWALAYVVVVVEKKWGFEPLRRSAYLIKGMRGVSFSMMVFYGMLTLWVLWVGSTGMANGAWGGWKGWLSFSMIFNTMFFSGLGAVLMLQSAAATAVLYVYCKAEHGELATEVLEEFDRDYVSLPFEDEKVPHVVAEV